jgi:tRNA modification GTPase
VLWVIDPATIDAAMPARPEHTLPVETRRWTVLNKADLLGPDSAPGLASRLAQLAGGQPSLTLSAADGSGIDDLIHALAQFAERFFTAEPALVTRERHRVALREAGAALLGALVLGPQGAEELVAEQIRLATRALERLTGRIGVEDILDVIFRDFCIGK